jgi:hypothetical protein
MDHRALLEQFGFSPTGGPEPAERVDELERFIGVRLPSDYREFLLNVGGGDLDDVIVACTTPTPLRLCGLKSEPTTRQRTVDMRLPRRRKLWLSAALLLAVAAGAWLLVPRNRFDRIHDGMSKNEVCAIIGGPGELVEMFVHGQEFVAETWSWRDGPNQIIVEFDDGKASGKVLHVATAWETLIWYAKHGAQKIGVKWD